MDILSLQGQDKPFPWDNRGRSKGASSSGKPSPGLRRSSAPSTNSGDSLSKDPLVFLSSRGGPHPEAGGAFPDSAGGGVGAKKSFSGYIPEVAAFPSMEAPSWRALSGRIFL